MSLEWVILAGVFKALRDRDEWGADNADHVELFYERWRWYKRWRLAGSFLWLELDSWHAFDMAGIFCLCMAFTDIVASILATTIALATFTLLYHGFLLRNPIAGVREWLRRYFKRS